MTTRTVTRLAGVVVAVTLTLSACGGPSETPTPTTTTAPAFAIDTSTPLGAINDRILQWINADAAPDPAAVDAVTGAELAAALAPMGGLVTPLEQLRAGAPNVATGVSSGSARGPRAASGGTVTPSRVARGTRWGRRRRDQTLDQ